METCNANLAKETLKGASRLLLMGSLQTGTSSTGTMNVLLWLENSGSTTDKAQKLLC